MSVAPVVASKASCFINALSGDPLVHLCSFLAPSEVLPLGKVSRWGRSNINSLEQLVWRHFLEMQGINTSGHDEALQNTREMLKELVSLDPANIVLQYLYKDLFKRMVLPL